MKLSVGFFYLIQAMITSGATLFVAFSNLSPGQNAAVVGAAGTLAAAVIKMASDRNPDGTDAGHAYVKEVSKT